MIGRSGSRIGSGCAFASHALSGGWILPNLVGCLDSAMRRLRQFLPRRWLARSPPPRRHQSFAGQVKPSRFSSLFTLNWCMYHAKGGGTTGSAFLREEGFIDQDRHTRGDGRVKTPARGDAVRRLGRAAIIIAALMLVALAWIGERDAVRTHRGEVRARVQAEILARTLTLEEQVRRELLSLDQTLRILEYEWQRDPDHFDVAARASQAVVLSDVSLQLFIADARGIVQSSSRPAIIGTDISKRDYFR